MFQSNQIHEDDQEISPLSHVAACQHRIILIQSIGICVECYANLDFDSIRQQIASKHRRCESSRSLRQLRIKTQIASSQQMSLVVLQH